MAAGPLTRLATPPTARAPRRAAPLALSLVLCALPVLWLALAGWAHRWMSDDGFINVRVVDNVFAGHGPVFNVGERVEVATSTAWLAVLVVGHALTPFLEVSTFAVAAGLVCTVLGVVASSLGAAVLWAGSRRGAQAPPQLVLPLGTVVLAALPPFWDFATSGLETGLGVLWLGATFLALARRWARGAGDQRASAWRPVWPAVLVGLGPLVRPDLALVSVAFAVALLAQSRRSWGSWCGAALVAGAVPAAWEVVRAAYYATLVPNTALAKSAAGAEWSQGWHYLQDYAGRYLLAVPLVLAAVGALLPLVLRLARGGDAGPPDRAGVALALAPVVGGVVHAAYVVRLGGDFMHARFLLPSTVAVLLPVAVVQVPYGLRSAAAAVPRLAVLAGVVVWGLVVGVSVRVPYHDTVSPLGISDERGVYVSTTRNAHPVTVEDWAAQGWAVRGEEFGRRAAGTERFYVDTVTGDVRPSAPGRRIVVRIANIGIFGTTAGPEVTVADSLSLADAVGSRLVLPPGPHERTGHAHEVPGVWQLARYGVALPDDPPTLVDARAALACGGLAELQTDITAPLTPRRLLHNLLDAPGLTRLRVPADPAQARAQLCR